MAPAFLLEVISFLRLSFQRVNNARSQGPGLALPGPHPPVVEAKAHADLRGPLKSRIRDAPTTEGTCTRCTDRMRHFS